MDYWPTSLSDLQRALLDGLAGRASFYLTGGAALSAFFLHHRRSLDLDLFVTDAAALDELEALLQAECDARGWTAEELRRYPGHRRYLVRGDGEETIVDLVHEPVAQIVAPDEKPRHANLTVDDLDDLVANKLCALLGRGDIKDLVDLYYLSESGVDVLAYLDAARRKDGGMEATTLAYVLRGMRTDPASLLLFEPLSPEVLAAFRDRLVTRLLRLAWPGDPPRAAGAARGGA